MTNTIPDIPDAGRYSIKETCTLLKISRSLLYSHINDELITPGTRPINGRKYFTGAEIKRFYRKQF